MTAPWSLKNILPKIKDGFKLKSISKDEQKQEEAAYFKTKLCPLFDKVIIFLFRDYVKKEVLVTLHTVRRS